MHALTVRVSAEAVESVSDHLVDACDALSVSVEDADAGSPDEQPVFDEPGVSPTGRWHRARLTALFAGEAEAVAAATSLAAHGLDSQDAIEAIAAVDDQDWVRLTQSQFGPIEIEPDFWIVPTWAESPAEATRVLRLDPGMAFGTGTHATTRMCLQWITRRGRQRASPWRRVLDYGCGSGVLAIAAGLLGARDVLAVDIDPAAVVATRANAEANQVRIDAGLPDSVTAQFDLIVANILATPLKLLAPLLSSHLEAGAELVLSGILERQADELRQAYAPWLALDVSARDDGWILMTGARPGDPRMA